MPKRFFAVVLTSVLLSAGAAAADPLSDVREVATERPFLAFVDALKAQVKENKLVLVGLGCATCGAKAIGVTIPGDRVFLVFGPRYAARMIQADQNAGIEAPLPIQVVETADGQAKVRYRLPSTVFGAYGNADLDALGKDLDPVFADLIEDAIAASGG